MLSSFPLALYIRKGTNISFRCTNPYTWIYFHLLAGFCVRMYVHGTSSLAWFHWYFQLSNPKQRFSYMWSVKQIRAAERICKSSYMQHTWTIRKCSVVLYCQGVLQGHLLGKTRYSSSQPVCHMPDCATWLNLLPSPSPILPHTYTCMTTAEHHSTTIKELHFDLFSHPHTTHYMATHNRICTVHTSYPVGKAFLTVSSYWSAHVCGD